jgi:hypothetical protein
MSCGLPLAQLRERLTHYVRLHFLWLQECSGYAFFLISH